jgi:hypothetical protein
MQGMVRCALVAGLLAGCHQADTASPDAGLDGSSQGPGLYVKWSFKPPVPGNVEDTLSVDHAMLTFDSLRVIGDAGPGDPRTTDSAFELDWNTAGVPAPLAFPSAPSGLYSKVSLALDGHLVAPSYHIDGHVTVSGQSMVYEIEDRNALSVSLTIDKTLAPGGTATVALYVDIKNALAVIDFASLRFDDGKLQLDTLDLQMPAFRAKLIESIKVDNSAPN